jgi:hypothetical protein
VGAIYNGTVRQGLVHVIVLGLLISIINSNSAGGLEPLFGLLIGLWFFYMAFEAYHTASKRQKGETVDEFSSIVPVQSHASGFPVVPILLIVIGIVFLLVNLDWCACIRCFAIGRIPDRARHLPALCAIFSAR